MIKLNWEVFEKFYMILLKKNSVFEIFVGVMKFFLDWLKSLCENYS